MTRGVETFHRRPARILCRTLRARVSIGAFRLSEACDQEPLRADFPLNARTLTVVTCVAVVLMLAASRVRAQQQTNPVDRKVENPITDTPSVNPLSQDQPPIRPRPRRTSTTSAQQGTSATGVQATDELEVRADHDEVSGPENARVVVYTGNVDARI